MKVQDQLILVDSSDREIGISEKMEAHRLGLLHRAVSVFLFDGEGRMLIQKRSPDKYHSPDLWSNSCCTHPYPGESVSDAARRRLKEELSIDCAVNRVGSLIYKSDVGNGLTEHEYDHLFIGCSKGRPQPNSLEVSEFRFVKPQDLEKELRDKEEDFTAWFKILLPEFSSMVDLNSYLSVMNHLDLRL